MSHPYYHAKSSVKKFGGAVEDYIEIHNFLDSTKSTFADWRHRAILHNSFGCFVCEKIFGVTIKNSEDKNVPVRTIAEQHIKEDLGYIPSIQDWLIDLPPKQWALHGVEKLEKD